MPRLTRTEMDRVARQLESLSVAPNLTDWEENFVQSLTDQIDRTGSLSERQLEILENLHMKKG